MRGAKDKEKELGPHSGNRPVTWRSPTRPHPVKGLLPPNSAKLGTKALTWAFGGQSRSKLQHWPCQNNLTQGKNRQRHPLNSGRELLSMSERSDQSSILKYLRTGISLNLPSRLLWKWVFYQTRKPASPNLFKMRYSRELITCAELSAARVSQFPGRTWVFSRSPVHTIEEKTTQCFL